MAELSESDQAILKDRNYAHLATVMPDGSPHVSPVWIDLVDGLLLINSAEGRTKVRNMRRDQRVGVSVHDQGDPSIALILRGAVVEMTHEGADADIDALSRKYDGVPWEPVPGQRRVTIRIRPDHVTRAT